jgi:hypothetical protein
MVYVYINGIGLAPLRFHLPAPNQTPGGLRRSAFIWLVAARAATQQIPRFLQV